MLKHRIPSGIMMTLGLVLLMWADDALGRRGMPPGLILLGLVIALGALASTELAALLRAKWGHCSRLSTFGSAAVGCLMVYLLPMIETPRTAVAFFGSGVAGVLFFSMFRHSFLRKETQGAAAAGANAVFAMVYLGILPGMYLLIREAGYSAWVIAAIIMVVKSCDIGAYFTGRFLGKHKLIEWLSPGKTWEGLVGGMLFAGLWAVVFTLIGNHLVPERAIAPLYALPAGMLLGFLGQVGDLVASLLKRDAGVKDWAATIPGFGGVMDVADSALIVAPVAYWLITLAPAA
ncbi:phosphatidate cytidylyltransferase [Algisphaera agarilytica]|uniref:Phosphatidate cytidylyltransferase n=1 Tax=Algisphaera agarilytica TaxID=1385975 RepID=A0A7X0H6H6_9BACT|nr:phosphatidate cytidylyltransferase [Algisphaera agarilytica]MBB6428710.1 phosphatidate cytidylyltransferase [Algisphaera agarilytica]